MRLITVSVRHVASATPRTRIIHLDLGGAAFPFAAGQAVMVGLHGSPLRKPYSIASAPWEVDKTGVLQLLAQVEDTGAPDPHLELAQPGTSIDVEGPFGTFGLPAGIDEAPLLFVAGGTGIAPLRSMLMARLARNGRTEVRPSHAGPPIAVVYSARAPEEFAYRAELDAIAIAGRIRLWLTVSRPEGEWPGRRGRIDESLLRDALPSTNAIALVCGPPTLVREVSDRLHALGVPADRILTEKF